jgi:predicted CxxxxCH...CXXCH cytochrome family protein
MHNSVNMESTKWGGNWGMAGGQYGEFTCGTCHTPGATTNIKRIKEMITAPSGAFPGGAVNFQTTTTPNGFGDDSDAHATSNKVCEVCHTYDASQANGVKYHAYNMSAGGADLAHNNNLDCVTCHKHSAAFKASCGSCHGNPPTVDTLGGPNGLANDPFPTGSVTAGAHNAHVTKYNDCTFCHSNSVMPVEGVFAGKGDISIGFSYFGITTGSYSGQLNVSYNQVAGTGGLTCSAVYCHGTTMAPNGGTDTTPAWNDPASGACGTCHGATTANPPTKGLHVKHAGAYSPGFSKAYACTLCHTLALNQHVNNKSEIIFGSDARVTGATYTGTDTMLDAYGNCSTVYCHSNVQTSPPGGAVTYKTVNWGSSQTFKCNVCHEGPADHTTWPASFASGNTTGSHSKHATYTIYCGTCHASDVTQDPADIATNGRCNVCHSTDKHSDHAINVSIVNIYGGTYSGDTTPGNAYGGCSSVYCHSKGTSFTAPSAPNTAATWGGAVTTCGSCHDGLATGPTYTNGTPKANSHNAHVVANGFTCNNCHNDTTSTGNTITDVAKHANKAYNLQAGGAGISFTPTIGNPTTPSSCATISCHGGGNATWGTTLSCQDCHRGTGDVDDYTYGNATTARVDATEWTGSGHGATGIGNNGCIYCHNPSVGHNVGTNPFRLVNAGNNACYACHLTGSTGYNPGTGLVTSTKKIDKFHQMAAHTASGRNGGKFCWDCHDPHGDGNIKMVQANPAPTTDGTYGIPTSVPPKTVVFTNNAVATGAGGFAMTSGSFNQGICNVCHTASASNPKMEHYTSTSSDSHNSGTVCTTCHTHSADTTANGDAFKGGGSCDGCHDYDTGAGAWGKNPQAVEGYGAHKLHINHIKTTTGAALNPGGDSFGSGSAAAVCGTCHTNAGSNHASGTRVINFGDATYKEGGAAGFSFIFGPTNPVYNGVPGTSSFDNLKSCSAVGCHFRATPVWSSY